VAKPFDRAAKPFTGLSGRLYRLIWQRQNVADGDRRERWMAYLSNLSNVTNERPMLRISATIILAFTCAAPFVLLFSGAVGYGVRSLIH
jgi:hypothetical protein